MMLSIFTLLFFTSSCTAQNNVLSSGEKLRSGQSLTYGAYSLTMQSDCNLVLYDKGEAVWASDTGGLAAGCHVSMESDGNLVVYGNNEAVWASNTGGGGQGVVILQGDGNVVIYRGASWPAGNGGSVRGVEDLGAAVVVNEIENGGERIVMVTEK